MSTIQVLHLLGPLRASGMERMLVSSSKLWSKNGIRPIILGQGNSNPFKNELLDAGYEVQVISTVRSFRGICQFVNVLRILKPDIVHVHTESMHGPIALLIRLLLPKCKIIRTIHGIFHFSGMKLVKRKFQHLLSTIAGVRHVSVSEGVAKIEMKHYRLKSVVIENWLDPIFLSPTEFPARSETDSTKIALLGNCSLIKNHAEILSAVSNSPNLHVHHIGDETFLPDEELELFKILERAGKLVRYGQRSDIRALLMEVDFLVLPSLHEGFSVALAEAISLGIPCLINESEGTSWANNLPGVNVRPSKISWTEFLKDLTPEYIRIMRDAAQSARRAYSVRFSPERGIREYRKVYES